ncbi:hypothetical protein PanWU01x14_117820 [Parasponia andersonii]|uniref:Uncharacterized protein n=1 Tax=Parasponia andersonii TaxID=3476 RepID=A0A2P5CW36_PARAD|nr:hypothetical protein PanWU01x14_117820 [Parasponia andersonii]
MSSIGASCAGVYVMQKRQKEKMERMEEERARRGESQDNKVAGSGRSGGGSNTLGRSKKIHPGNFPGAESN